MKILIDNGHGAETPGKQSPDQRLREYAYTRELAMMLMEELKKYGIDAERIVTEDEDIPLRERCRRVNEICRNEERGEVLLVSIHCNAAGCDEEWHQANGWSAHVAVNASKASRSLACSLITAAEESGLKVRKYSYHEPYWTQNLAICRDTQCPAVLTENLFQDNQSDVDFLLSEEGKRTIVNLHVKGIRRYLQAVTDSRPSAEGMNCRSPILHSVFSFLSQISDLVGVVKNIIAHVRSWFKK